MATHFSALAWRIPGTVEPGGLPSMGSHAQSRTRPKRLSSSSSSSLGLKDHAIVNTCILDVNLLCSLLLDNHFIVYKLLSILNVLSKFMKVNSTK